MLISHPRAVTAIAASIAVLAAAAGSEALTNGSSGVALGSTHPVAVERSSLPGAMDAIVGGSGAGDTLPGSTFPATLPPTTAAPGAPVAPPALVRTTVPASELAANGIPTAALRAYKRGAAAANKRTPSCRIPWPLVAAIGRVESDHGRFADNVLHADGVSTPGIVGIALDGNGTEVVRDTDRGAIDGDRTYDRAVGPMQFIPSTWTRWRVDADHDGKADVNDIDDAAAATAAYLCANDRNLRTYAGQRNAVLSYNHSTAYLTSVLALEQVYARGVITVPTAPGKGDASRPKLPSRPSPAATTPNTPGNPARTSPVTTTAPKPAPVKTRTSGPTRSPSTTPGTTTPKPSPTCSNGASASPSAGPSPSASSTACASPTTSTAKGSATSAATAAVPSSSPTN